MSRDVGGLEHAIVSAGVNSRLTELYWLVDERLPPGRRGEEFTFRLPQPLPDTKSENFRERSRSAIAQ